MVCSCEVRDMFEEAICFQKMFAMWDEKEAPCLLLHPLQPGSVLPAPMCKVAIPGRVCAFFPAFLILSTIPVLKL